MTLAQALELKKGQSVCSPHDRVPYHPRRLTDVWVSENRKYVRIRIAAVSPNWISPEMWTPQPETARWDGKHATWRDQNNRPFTPVLERDPEQPDE